MRRAHVMPFAAMAAMLMAALALALPASAAASTANSPSAKTAAAGPVAAPSAVTTFIKSFVDSKSKNNDAAFGTDVFPTSDGGYIVTGTIGVSPYDAWVTKLSSAGTVQWQKQIGSGEFNAASGVQQTSDGGYIITGSSGVTGSSSVLVAKLSSAGTVQWQQTYGSGYNDSGNSVAQTSDGGYIVTGEVVSETPQGTIPGEALLLKLSSTGAIQFQDVFNAGVATNLSSRGAAVKQTPDGGYVLAGSETLLSGGGTRVTASWLAKATSAGALSWQHIFYGPSDFSGFGSVRLTSDGGYIAAGTTGDFADADNFWLVKTDSSGNVASGSCKDQYAGTTTEQAGGLHPTTTFPVVTPPSNPPAATTDTVSTANLVTESVC